MSKAKRGNYHFLKPSSPTRGIYTLTVRQHPQNGKVSTVTEKAGERKTIDPATIVELNITDEDDDGSTDSSHYHYNPFLFAYTTLVDPQTKEELHFLPGENTRILTGSIASCVYHLKDPEKDNSFGAFFVFPDIAVRQEGSYCLKVSLFKIYSNTEDPTLQSSKVVLKQSVITNPFQVYSSRANVEGPPSSQLSISFAEQGLKLKLRKGTKFSNSGSKRDSESSDGESIPDSNSGKRSMPARAPPHAGGPPQQKDSKDWYPEHHDYYGGYPPVPRPPYPGYPPPTSYEPPPRGYPSSNAPPGPSGPPPPPQGYWPHYYPPYPYPPVRHPTPHGYENYPPPPGYPPYGPPPHVPPSHGPPGHANHPPSHPAAPAHPPHPSNHGPPSHPISSHGPGPSHNPPHGLPSLNHGSSNGHPATSPSHPVLPPVTSPHTTHHEEPLRPTNRSPFMAPLTKKDPVDSGSNAEPSTNTEEYDPNWDSDRMAKRPRFEPTPHPSESHDNGRASPLETRRPSLPGMRPPPDFYNAPPPSGQYPPYPPPPGYGASNYPPYPGAGYRPPRPPTSTTPQQQSSAPPAPGPHYGNSSAPPPYPPYPGMYYDRYPPPGGSSPYVRPPQPARSPQIPIDKPPTESPREQPDVWPSPRD